MLLKNKVIFLTGGSTGFGLDCAKAYAAEGAKVVLCARNSDLAAAEAGKLTGEHYGIRVNAVCPAGTWTPMLRQWCSEQPDPASIKQYLDDIHPLGYCPEGDVIADACVFLVSDKARFVTGHIMHVSGGAEIGYKR